VKYVSPFMDDCGVEDELNPNEEPFEASFSRLMDIASQVEADEDTPKVVQFTVSFINVNWVLITT